MRERTQPPPDRLPSTTRAVAWGAMFFSLLSFAFSLATFSITWHDGRLIHNFQEISGDIGASFNQWRARKQAAPGEKQGDEERNLDVGKLRDKVGQAETMIRGGDGRAR